MAETDAAPARQSPYGWGRDREFRGPVRLQTIGPSPQAEGEPIPAGTEFVAAPGVAKSLWYSGLVGVVREYGLSEDAPDTDGPADVEIQLRLLEVARQRAAQRNKEAEEYQAREQEAMEERLGGLESLIGDLLSKYTDGQVSPDDPHLVKRLREWEYRLAEGEVPEGLNRRVFDKDREKAESLLSYARVVGSLRSRVRQGLGWALPAATVLANRQEAQLRILMLEAQGETAEAREHQQQLDDEALEAADAYDLAVPELLEALEIALGLLAEIDPEHLILGARTHLRLREIAQKDYRAAAVELFRQVMEREGVRKLSEVLYWAGTSYYQTVEMDGVRFSFKKQNKELVISAVDDDGATRVVRRQGFTSSAIYEWRSDAQKALDQAS